MAKFSQAYVGGLENNTRVPSLKTIANIADVLGVTLRTLINLSEYYQLLEKYNTDGEKRISKFAEELTKIGTPEALAYRDISNEFDIQNLGFKLGCFLDKTDAQKRFYESEKFPYVDNINLSSLLSKSTSKQNNILFQNKILTDGQINGLEQYLIAITSSQKEGFD
ncbi:helix-turn-helix transcriptional regulator [Carnobacterium maltaromaticum]|uniref:helix-turn-helix domain-containing protein n=1 Tax=Carnobacterium maltaromaticum TaxID=2751 RepID=UPI00295F1F80|nr:helix-turn-helix transcriptional regulator [Carnobacterium maltaromaticum]